MRKWSATFGLLRQSPRACSQRRDQPSLDVEGKRFDDAQGTAAFGTVVAGMDVVRKINEQSVASRAATAENPLTKTQNLDPPIRINRAYRVGSPRVATTDRDGKYQFTDVPSGTYTLTVESSLPGFKKWTRVNIVMVAGSSLRADCLLEWSGWP